MTERTQDYVVNGTRVGNMVHLCELSLNERTTSLERRKQGVSDILSFNNNATVGDLYVRDRPRFNAYEGAGVNAATFLQQGEKVTREPAEVFPIYLKFKFDPRNMSQHYVSGNVFPTKNSEYSVTKDEEGRYMLIGNERLVGKEGREIKMIAGLTAENKARLDMCVDLDDRKEFEEYLGQKGEEPAPGLKMIAIFEDNERTVDGRSFWIRTTRLQS